MFIGEITNTFYRVNHNLETDFGMVVVAPESILGFDEGSAGDNQEGLFHRKQSRRTSGKRCRIRRNAFSSV